MGETWWVGEDELDDDQKDVIALPLTGSHLITGPPGSGKTNLLLLRGNYMTLAGKPDIAIIVFSRTLQEFIVSGARGYAFPAEKIQTSRRWAQQLLFQYGVFTSPPQGFEEQRLYFLELVTDLVDTRKLSHIYDGILLDEAQDYLPEEIEMFSRLARVLFVVADPRQKIYATPDPIQTVRTLAHGKEHALEYHYRCGRNVCKVADAFGKDSSGYHQLLPTSHYDEAAKPSSVEHFRCRDIVEQTRRIIEKLSVQLKAYPDDELFGVLCPRVEDVDTIWRIIADSPLGDVAILQKGGEHAAFDPERPIVVGTFHSAKGVEFRGLHLAGCDALKRFRLQRNISYMAVTRCKTTLSIYYSNELPGYFEKALGAVDPVPSLPKIKDVFGRKDK
jgi:superfamily I DNA/RNA helicase